MATTSTAVQDRSALDLAGLKTYLGVVEDRYDDILEEVLEEAKEEADAFMCNPFVECGTEAELAIPKSVERGIKQWCATAWAEQMARDELDLHYADLPGRENRPGVITQGQVITSISTRTEEGETETVNFAPPKSSRSGVKTHMSYDDIKKRYWVKWRLISGF